MALRLLAWTWLAGLAWLAAGCATWHNPSTGETRDSPPSYPQCQRPEVVRGLDQECWRACMDRWYRLRGLRNSGDCDMECARSEGRTVMVDDEACNAEKARQDGWISK
ncbi:MAG: hypothetical protein HY910_09740 [Desulfarculus sp.]|nr:hypothetical protein [Desulfarculus sp.]